MASQNSRTAEVTARTPQRRRGHDRVATLLDAAAAVFVERGYEAATMTEVAARAGASIGSLYQFFPTKPVLAEALHLRELDALAAALDASQPAGSSSLAGIADQLFGALLAFAADHPAFGVLAERRDIDPARKEKTRAEMRAGIARQLAAARPAPALGRAEAAAALVLVAMRAAVSLRMEAMPGWEGLVDELRTMLRDHLAKPQRPR